MKNTAITSETKSYYSTNTSYLTKFNFDGERSNPHSPWTAAQITILEIRVCLKTTEKEVAQLILNKDEKYIRQEILTFLTDDEIVAEVKPSEKCNGSCDLLCQCSMCKCTNVKLTRISSNEEYSDNFRD
jgi:hypothetical protein